MRMSHLTWARRMIEGARIRDFYGAHKNFRRLISKKLHHSHLIDMIASL